MSGVQLVKIAAAEADQRLDRWLKKRFPQLTQIRIEKACRKGEIRVDGGRVKPALRLAEGQEVRVPPLPPAAAAPAHSPRPRISDAGAQMMERPVQYRDGMSTGCPPRWPQGGRRRALCTGWIRTPRA